MLTKISALLSYTTVKEEILTVLKMKESASPNAENIYPIDGKIYKDKRTTE